MNSSFSLVSTQKHDPQRIANDSRRLQRERLRFPASGQGMIAPLSKILLSQLLCNELEIQFSLHKRTDDSGLKLLEEKNSSIAMELGMDMARARRAFLLHNCWSSEATIKINLAQQSQMFKNREPAALPISTIGSIETGRDTFALYGKP